MNTLAILAANRARRRPCTSLAPFPLYCLPEIPHLFRRKYMPSSPSFRLYIAGRLPREKIAFLLGESTFPVKHQAEPCTELAFFRHSLRRSEQSQRLGQATSILCGSHRLRVDRVRSLREASGRLPEPPTFACAPRSRITRPLHVCRAHKRVCPPNRRCSVFPVLCARRSLLRRGNGRRAAVYTRNAPNERGWG